MKMHNIDRTVQELGNEFSGEYNELEALFNQEFEGEFEDPEMFGESSDEALQEMQEMELATEFLSVSNEEELEEFLGKLFKKVGAAAKKVWHSPVGNLLRKGLKTVAPMAGAAIGGFFGGPIGAKIGGKLATGATRLFGLELEGLSPEDQEFEVARAYVRFASEAAKKAAQHSQNGVSPKKAAQAAFVQAAKKHAPGLLKISAREFEAAYDENDSSVPESGTWYRQGNRIFINGLAG